MTDLRTNPLKIGGNDVTQIRSKNKSNDGLAYGLYDEHFGLLNEDLGLCFIKTMG